jgi:hypothetical protein
LVSVGNHVVEFSEIPGWIAPDLPGVTINSGQTTTFNDAYTKPQGSLTVTIEPDAVVSAGAKWRVDGGPWQNSGDVVTGLDDGTHTVEFIDISGWTTPDSQNITISNDESVTASGTYTEGDDSNGESGGGGGCFIGAMFFK